MTTAKIVELKEESMRVLSRLEHDLKNCSLTEYMEETLSCAEGCIFHLLSEIDSMAKDAERYRFIRSPSISHRQHNQLLYAVDDLSEVLMDQAIDEAMQGK